MTVMSSNDLTPFGSRWERVNLAKQHRQRQMEATNNLRRPLGDITNVDILPSEGPGIWNLNNIDIPPSENFHPLGYFLTPCPSKKVADVPSTSPLGLPKGSPGITHQQYLNDFDIGYY